MDEEPEERTCVYFIWEMIPGSGKKRLGRVNRGRKKGQSEDALASSLLPRVPGGDPAMTF